MDCTAVAGGLPQATEQAILLREPYTGTPQAEVILRPVKLLELERLLSKKELRSNDRRMILLVNCHSAAV